MTSAQCRAARALLGWTQKQLARVSVVTVLGATTPLRATLDVLSRALETAGVVFITENDNGPGVRLKSRQ